MKRIFSAALFGFPVVAMIVAGIAACSEDAAEPADERGPNVLADTADGAADATTSTIGDAADAAVDAAEADAGDAATLPALCVTYSNAGIAPDAAAGEGEDPIPRWDLVAYRALEAAALTCEVGGVFADNFGDPTAYECLGLQLADLLGCPGTIAYALANDNNGSACAPDAGNIVQLGFRNPADVTYTLRDVDFFIALVGQVAAGTGVAQLDVARLVTTLREQRRAVVGDEGLDAGPDGGDFSQSSCP